MFLLKRLGLIAGFAVAGLIVGCEQKTAAPQEQTAQPATAAAAALPAGLFVATAPDGARGVHELKADADAQQEVVVHGRIGGSRAPFVDGVAVFLLADSDMKSCAEEPGDQCPTPWDYCCEPRDSLTANTLTVQVVGADGKPLRLSLDGQHGLKPLQEITVVGDVALRDGQALVVNAKRIYIAPAAG